MPFEDAPDGESIEGFWRSSFARWLFFAVGCYSSLAKVPSARGMPWTKTFSMSLYPVIVFFEVCYVWHLLVLRLRRISGDPGSRLQDEWHMA